MDSAKRDSSVLSVDGSRVAQSFSRGEVWLLKQILLAVHSPPRLRELADDSGYAKLLQKAQRMLAEADRRAAAQPKPGRRGQQTKLIQQAYKAWVSSGKDWNATAFAAELGIPYRSVMEATRPLRPLVRAKSAGAYDGESEEAAE